jgi:hypothetical protein
MKFWQKFSLKFLLLSVLSAIISSCSSQTLLDVNKNFEKKFSKDVEKINLDRTSDSTVGKVTVMQSPSPAEVNAQNRDYYPYVDVNKFNDRPPEIYLPNGESYEQTKALNPSNSLPEDMFEISYNLGLYPAFRRAGAEFDRIEIPPQDAYGVKTKLSDKSYLLAGNDSMQKAVDQINTQKSAQDIANSQILISERKALRRKQQIQKTFGESEMQMAEIDDKKSNSKKQK